VLSLVVFKDFAVGTVLSLLLMLKFKQSAVDLTNIGTRALSELLFIDISIGLDILVKEISQIELSIEFDSVCRI